MVGSLNTILVCSPGNVMEVACENSGVSKSSSKSVSRVSISGSDDPDSSFSSTRLANSRVTSLSWRMVELYFPIRSMIRSWSLRVARISRGSLRIL